MNGILFLLAFTAGCSLMGVILRLAIRGRKSAFYSAAIIAAFGGIFAKSLSSEFGVHLALCVCGLGLSLILLHAFSQRYRRVFRQRVQMCDAVKEYGLRRFNFLDGDGDGLITRLDLFTLVEEGRLSDDDLPLVRILQRDLSLIGHVTDVIVAPAAMMGAMGHYAHVGINREDLRTYPQRIREIYAEEFGPVGDQA